MRNRDKYIAFFPQDEIKCSKKLILQKKNKNKKFSFLDTLNDGLNYYSIPLT